jgi:GNAT superfamily N-acetyltransferase
MHYNSEKVPFTQKINPIFKKYIVKDKEEIVAGINAVMYHWGMLYVDELFVAEVHRHKGIGEYLLRKVEKEAKELGATLSHLDTFNFQAKDFYLKQGYEVFG